MPHCKAKGRASIAPRSDLLTADLELLASDSFGPPLGIC